MINTTTRPWVVAALVTVGALSCDSPVCACSPPVYFGRVVGLVEDGVGPVSQALVRITPGLSQCGAAASGTFLGLQETVAELDGTYAMEVYSERPDPRQCARIRAARPSVVNDTVVAFVPVSIGSLLDSTVVNLRFP